MVILAAAIPALGYVGFKKVFNTTEGRRVDAQNDPTRTNYEANVAPTPVLLFAQTNPDGVSALTMLSLGGSDTGGGVLFIPVNTVTNQLTTTTSTTAPAKTTTTKAPGMETTTLTAAFVANGEPDLSQLTANVVGCELRRDGRDDRRAAGRVRRAGGTAHDQQSGSLGGGRLGRPNERRVRGGQSDAASGRRSSLPQPAQSEGERSQPARSTSAGVAGVAGRGEGVVESERRSGRDHLRSRSVCARAGEGQRAVLHAAGDGAVRFERRRDVRARRESGRSVDDVVRPASDAGESG